MESPAPSSSFFSSSGGELNKKTFFNHVFNTSEEGKAEILNIVQYAILAIIPIVILNKTINRFIPDASDENSSLELTIEILIQLIVLTVGIVIIHRLVSYVPTFSGFKYDNLILTHALIPFLIIILSIQTKMGIKVNIIFDRLMELWNGPQPVKGKSGKNGVRVSQPISRHVQSQADYLDNSGVQNDMFPPAPVVSSRGSMETYDTMMRGSPNQAPVYEQPLMAANALLGNAFGKF